MKNQKCSVLKERKLIILIRVIFYRLHSSSCVKHIPRSLIRYRASNCPRNYLSPIENVFYIIANLSFLISAFFIQKTLNDVLFNEPRSIVIVFT